MSSFISSGPTSTVDPATGTIHDSHHQLTIHDASTPHAAAADARFSCSICTEAVVEPVVTHCGHLYCWPCLYRWLEHGMTLQERNDLFGNNNMMMSRSYNQNPYYDPSKRVCPVCRAPCSVKRVIPIYVRTDTTTASATMTPIQNSSSSSSQILATDDDILTTVETVMDDENDHDVMNSNHENEDEEDDRMVQAVGEEEEEEENLTSTLHTMGLRNRSRIRSSISEASNATIATTRNNHHHNEDSGNPHHNHQTTTAATSTAATVPRRPVARSSSNLRLDDRADVAAAAAASFPTHSRTSPITTTTATTNTQPAHHPASLAHGMLPLVQQAIRHAAMVAGTTTTNTSLMGNDVIPSIHRLEGMRNNNATSSPSTSIANHYGISMTDQPDPTSDFLSWILLLLGIFVLACLILF